MKDSSPDQIASVAVLDIGKTNVKLSAVTADGHVVETLVTPNRVHAGPPWRHHDLKDLGTFVMRGLVDLSRRHPISDFIASGHGSGGMLVRDDPASNGDGIALPMIDYEQSPPAAIEAAYPALAGSFHDRGSSIMMASTHQARQMLWMQEAEPTAFASARWFLGVSQYWAWWLTGRAVSEATILGAQSHLWNVPDKRWAPIVAARGWQDLMPPFAPAWADLGMIRPDLANRYGLDREIHVRAGIHDSSANFYRYQAAGLSNLMVVSTGTWIVALADQVDLDRLDEARGMTLNSDVHGEPIGGALTMGGREFSAVAGAEDGIHVADAGLVRKLISQSTMALPTFGSNDGQFPGTAGKGRIVGPPPENAAERRTLATLYAALLTLACIDTLDPLRKVILDGSFLSDPLFARLVAALRPQAATLYNPENYGVAAGAALLTGHLERTAPAPLVVLKPEAIDLRGLADYARRWRDLAGGVTGPLR